MDQSRWKPAMGLIAMWGVAVLVVCMTWSSAASPEPTCFYGNSVSVAISGRDFVIPDTYNTSIETIHGKHLSPWQTRQNLSCRDRSGAAYPEPIEARRISLGVPANKDARAAGKLYGVSLRISAWPLSRPPNPFRDFEKRVAQSGRTLDELPRLAGFYAFDRIENTSLHVSPFVSIPGRLVAPNGSPLVVQCSNPVAPSSVVNALRPLSECNVSYEWWPKLRIRYQFSPRIHPIDRLSLLDAMVRQFLDELVVSEDGRSANGG